MPRDLAQFTIQQAGMADGAGAIVAVTGPRGLVGEAVVRQLAESGFQVRRLSRVRLADNGTASAILPSFDAPETAFDDALAGVSHIVHAAALTNADATATETDFMNANARLTEKLAMAAKRITPGRFVFVSSIRAVAGTGFQGTIGASTKPVPSDAYGRSKRAAEIAAAETFADEAPRLTILRPAPVYGRGMKGNLGRLLRLARAPYPLPLAGLTNRRSLLDVEALARAVVHAVSAPAPIGGAYIVSDTKPVTIPQIVSAFRSGMGRKAGLFYLPPILLEGFALLSGQQRAVRGIFTDEVCDPSSLEATGWIATENSIGRLTALARPPLDGARP